MPLPAVHHLRESLNAVPPEQAIPLEIMDKYDAPVLASTVKLWMLELDPPLALWEGWDDVRRIYPSGACVSRLQLCAWRIGADGRGSGRVGTGRAGSRGGAAAHRGAADRAAAVAEGPSVRARRHRRAPPLVSLFAGRRRRRWLTD